MHGIYPLLVWLAANPPTFVSPYKDHRMTVSTVSSSSHPLLATKLCWNSQMLARAVLQIVADALFHLMLRSCVLTCARFRRLVTSLRAPMQNPLTCTFLFSNSTTFPQTSPSVLTMSPTFMLLSSDTPSCCTMLMVAWKFASSQFGFRVSG